MRSIPRWLLPQASIGLAAVGLLAFLVLATPARAQSLDPRSFVNTPVGINFIVGGYTYQSGNVLFDPTVPLEDARSALNLGIGMVVVVAPDTAAASSATSGLERAHAIV